MKKNNNNRKKGGLVLLGVSLLLSLIGMKETKALDLNLKNEQPYNYTYTNNGKQYPFYLASNIEDNMPIFQERGNAAFVDTSTYIKRNERLFMEPFELNALYLTTNGDKASTDNLDKRLAMQLYIFENFAKSNKDTISFSFDTNKYHQISEELLKQGQEMIEEKKFSYEVKQGEWTYIPKEWEGKYHIDDNCPFEIREEEDGFYIKGNKLGKFTTDIDIEDYKEDGYYFDSNHPTRSNYTEVIKPCTALTTLEINVVPAIFNIHFPSDQIGYDLEIASESLKNEQVVYNFKVHDDYDLKEFSITKKDGTKLTINNNSFTMPNEDVYINIEVSKKIHNIKIENSEGIEIDCLENAKVGDKVKINVKVLDGYEITNLYINNKEVNLKDLSFIMPNEDVLITSKIKKKIYKIENNNENVNVEILNESEFGKLVTFKVMPFENYEITGIKIIDEKGNEIKFNNNSFEMPKSNVKIIVTVKKKTYKIEWSAVKVDVDMVTEASFGEIVKINAKPQNIYQKVKYQILDANGNEITAHNDAFIMPNSNVTISFLMTRYVVDINFINASDGSNMHRGYEVEAGEIIEMPYFDGYTVKLKIGNNEYKEITDKYYLADTDLDFYYFKDSESEYKFEDIPNTYESGFEPLFGLLTIAMAFFLKKYLFS